MIRLALASRIAPQYWLEMGDQAITTAEEELKKLQQDIERKTRG